MKILIVNSRYIVKYNHIELTGKIPAGVVSLDDLKTFISGKLEKAVLLDHNK